MKEAINPSPLTRSLYISTAGMMVQNQRVLLVSQNIANAHVRASFPGGHPYQRQTISFQTVYDKTLKTDVVRIKKIGKDPTPFEKIYSPGDPLADSHGFVEESNVKPMIELTDMREASRSHEASLRAFERTVSMIQNTIGLLKG